MLKYVCEFTVTGNGEFPFDMLRYDRCSPYSSEDAGRIANTFRDFKATSVRLIRFTEGKGKNYNDAPTARRWESFGWRVSNVEYRKL